MVAERVQTRRLKTEGLTAGELWRRQSGGAHLELIEGTLHKMSPTGAEHSLVTSEIHYQLSLVVRRDSLGAIAAAETGFRLAEDTVLAPDVAFIAAARLPAVIPDDYFALAPDLAVEVVSPSDRYSRTLRKVRLYLMAGAQAVWVFNTPDRNVVVWRREGERLLAVLLTADDWLEGGMLLPGFRVRVGELFPF
jgi:Uma2 family endonuclease